VTNIRPFSSEIPNRLLQHDFRAENLNVLWESLSTGRSPLKWFERWRGNSTFSGNFQACDRRPAEANQIIGYRNAIGRRLSLMAIST
jgi:hypothetical protein